MKTELSEHEQLRQAMLAAQREMEQAENTFKLATKKFQELRWELHSYNERSAIVAAQDADRSKQAQKNQREAEQERKRAELIEVLPSLQFFR